MYAAILFEKLMCSTKRRERSSVGRTLTWLVVSRTRIIPVEASSCHSVQETTCLLFPDAPSVPHRTSSHTAEHCRAPSRWLVRQKRFSPVLQRAGSAEVMQSRSRPDLLNGRGLAQACPREA